MNKIWKVTLQHRTDGSSSISFEKFSKAAQFLHIMTEFMVRNGTEVEIALTQEEDEQDLNGDLVIRG